LKIKEEFTGLAMSCDAPMLSMFAVPSVTWHYSNVQGLL